MRCRRRAAPASMPSTSGASSGTSRGAHPQDRYGKQVAMSKTVATSKDLDDVIAYLGICSGCHVCNGRMIGPPVQVIQAMYADNPQGIADYIARPVKKRPDFPEMPPQYYLDPGTRLAVAKYMLPVTQ